MAMTYGLDAPITDPTSEGIVDHIKAFEVLNFNDVESKDYIAHMDAKKETDEPVKGAIQNETKDLKTIVIKGLKDEVAQVTKNMLVDKGPMEIVDQHLIPALDIVGSKFDKGELYLPQLIRSAETVKRSFEIIKSKLSTDGGASISNGRIILATVKGDIHDIGKNIVKVILENYGYDIIDLGKDVPPELIVKTAKEENIKLIWFKCTYDYNGCKYGRNYKNCFKEENLDCKVLVGGAVLTPEYAEMI